MNTVKVSGVITTEESAQLAMIAKQRETTIGNIVTYAVREAIRALKGNARVKLERDGRLPKA